MSTHNTALQYAILQDFKPAIGYFEKSLKLGEELKDKYGIGVNLKGMAAIYHMQAKYKKAGNSFTKALSNIRETKSRELEAEILIRLGKLHTEIRAFKTAHSYLSEAEKTS